MASAIPKTMKALVVLEDRSLAVRDHPVPSIADNDILVKVVAVALNPTDCKSPALAPQAGVISGCDWSGTVVAVGKDVTTRTVGDHVAGFVHGAHYTDSGAFAEYVKTPAELSVVIPPGTVSHEEAATLGCGLWTAAQAFYHPKRLALVEPPAKVDTEEWVFVYGGSSSVGQYAVQLAHVSGYKVVSTCSPRNFELVKSLGADAIVDYNDPGAVEKIKSATGDAVHFALDTISVRESQEMCVRAIAPGGGKVMLLLTPIPEAKVRDDVDVSATLLYTALGKAFKRGTASFPASAEDRAQIAGFLPKLPPLIAARKIVPNKIKFWEGGLGAITEGMQYMKDGKVSAEKIVWRI